MIVNTVPKNFKTNFILATGLFVGLFSLYVYTAAPTVFDGDSGELATVIHTLGLAHPTGFPIYIIIGKLVSSFGSDPARTLNLLSSFFIVFSAVFLFFIFLNLKINRFASFFSAIVFALGKSLWYHGGIVAVYPMSVFFITLLLLIFVKWKQEFKTRYIYVYALVWGLSMGTHSVMLSLIIPLTVMLWDTRKQLKVTSHLKLIGILLLAALQYLYIPFAYTRNQIVTFGSIKDFTEFLHYITQRDYAFKIGVRGLSDIPLFLGQVITTLSNEFGLVFFLLGILGLIVLFKKDLKLSIILAGLFTANMVMLFFYGAKPDLELLYRYLYLDYVVLAICIAFGVYWIYEKLTQKQQYKILFYIALLLGMVFIFQDNFKYNNRHNNYVVSDFAHNILMTPDQNSIVISEGDAVSGPLWYLQSIGQRPDVVLVDANALTLDWYVESMHKRYPNIIDFELTKLYGTDRDSHKNKRLMAFINKNISKHSIYFASGLSDPIVKEFEPLPAGVLYKIYPKGSVGIEMGLRETDEKWNSYSVRGVRRSEYYSPQTNDIVRFYSIILSNTGALNFINNRPDIALNYLEKAVSIDPTYSQATKNLDAIKKLLNK